MKILRSLAVFLIALAVYMPLAYGQSRLAGDANCDGSINFDDIDAFVIALSGQASYQAAYPGCNWLNADTNIDGTVSFDDIDPFIARLAACGVNQPPVSNAGPDQTAQPQETVTFSGNESHDPDQGNATLAYDWNFGDGASASGLLVQHAFQAAGQYQVTLSVSDNCGAMSTDSLNVQVLPSGPLQAAFVVEQLVYKDTQSGEEIWIPAGGSPSEALEFGLRVRLRSTSSGDIAYTYWDFGDGSFGDGATTLHQFSVAGPIQVIIHIYSADFTQYSGATRTIYVGPAITRISQMPMPPTTFFGQYVDYFENDLWAINHNGVIGAAHITQPQNLPPISLMPVPPLGYATVTDLEVSNQPLAQRKLYVAVGNGGIKTYRANQQAFVWLADVPTSYLGGRGALSLQSAGNLLYVLTFSPCQLIALDMSVPQSPQVLDSLPMTDGCFDFAVVQDQALVVVNNYHRFSVIDVRIPTDLRVSHTRDVPELMLGGPVRSSGSLYAVAAVGATLIYDLPQPSQNSQPYLSSYLSTIPQGNYFFVMDETHIYMPGPNPLYSKYDIRDPFSPYLQEQFTPTPSTVWSMAMFKTAAGKPFVLTPAAYYAFESWANP